MHDEGPSGWREELNEAARRAGFFAVGIAPARTQDHAEHRLMQWLESGMHGEMEYMARSGAARANAETVLPGAQSVLVFAAAYDAPPAQVGQPVPPPAPEHVKIAAYATGQDYHTVLKSALRETLIPWLAERIPGHEWRAVTDSAPLLERSFAVMAGLGFIGKNTMLIAPGHGSYFFLAEVVTTAQLPPDQPITGTCGRCTRCLDACPTQAFTAPGVLDARLCISYRTIEKNTPLSASEENELAGWAFGCDVCQQVCPYNKAPEPSGFPEFRDGTIVHRVEPAKTLTASRSNREFERRFQNSPLLRPGKKRLADRAAAAARGTSDEDSSS